MNGAWNHFDFVGLKRNGMRTKFEQSGPAEDVGPIMLILTKSSKGFLGKNRQRYRLVALVSVAVEFRERMDNRSLTVLKKKLRN